MNSPAVERRGGRAGTAASISSGGLSAMEPTARVGRPWPRRAAHRDRSADGLYETARAGGRAGIGAAGGELSPAYRTVPSSKYPWWDDVPFRGFAQEVLFGYGTPRTPLFEAVKGNYQVDPRQTRVRSPARGESVRSWICRRSWSLGLTDRCGHMTSSQLFRRRGALASIG